METNEDTTSSPPSKTSGGSGQLGSLDYREAMNQYITRDEVVNEQRKQVYDLPFSKRWPFDAADTYLPVAGTFSGLVCSSFFRRMLMIRQSSIFASLSMAVLPGMSVKLGWLAYVTTPILAGDLQCSICGEMRGALVNVSFGVLYPMLIGLPFYSALAKRHQSIEILPLKMVVTDWTKFSKFWSSKLRHFKLQFVTLLLFQGVVGTVVAKMQMDVCENEVKSKFVRVKEKDLWD